MDLILVGVCLATVISLYFGYNPMKHNRWFVLRRFINWFPLGMSYAFLYMGRYNLNVSKNALGSLMTKEDFGLIFGVGTAVYAISFLVNGPLVDKLGGKKGILIATLGSSMANALMGYATWTFLNNPVSFALTPVFCALYGLNMYFQSYGAVSIIKTNAYWFHVRERGIFGAVFGTLISFGVYFAFDWGQAIVDATKATANVADLGFVQQTIRNIFALEGSTIDATWAVFFIPSVLLIFWAILDTFLIKASPADAGLGDLETHDASADDHAGNLTTREILRKIFTHPVLLTAAAVEFCSGIIRNGIMQWYFIFAKESALPGSEFFMHHWGLLLCIAGIFGGFSGGGMSDIFFGSRRGPPAVILNGVMFVMALLMVFFLYRDPVVVGVAAIVISLAVIGVHSMMSGTAAMDFGGRKATATASGILDGFVYLGSAVQSISLGYLTTRSWYYWPMFLAPFALIGGLLALRIWNELPAATKRYMAEQARKAN